MHPENLIKMIRKQALFKVDKIEFKANISIIQIKKKGPTTKKMRYSHASPELALQTDQEEQH